MDGTGICWGHGGSTRPLSPGNGDKHRGCGKALSFPALTPRGIPSPWNTLLPQPCSQSHTLTQNSFAQVFIQS